MSITVVSHLWWRLLAVQATLSGLQSTFIGYVMGFTDDRDCSGPIAWARAIKQGGIPLSAFSILRWIDHSIQFRFKRCEFSTHKSKVPYLAPMIPKRLRTFSRRYLLHPTNNRGNMVTVLAMILNSESLVTIIVDYILLTNFDRTKVLTLTKTSHTGVREQMFFSGRSGCI